MTRQTGMIITGVLAVLFGCCSFSICLFGGLTAAGEGTFNDAPLDPAVGIAMLCFGIILLAIPVASYFLLVHNKPANPSTPPV
jgi:hypothetical protein